MGGGEAIDGGAEVGCGGGVGGSAVLPDAKEVGEGAEDGYDGQRIEFGLFEEGDGGGGGGGGVRRGFRERSVVWWARTPHGYLSMQ